MKKYELWLGCLLKIGTYDTEEEAQKEGETLSAKTSGRDVLDLLEEHSFWVKPVKGNE